MFYKKEKAASKRKSKNAAKTLAKMRLDNSKQVTLPIRLSLDC